MANRLITFTTDFGLSDHFVGVMKGVVAGIAPTARVVDITHDIAPHNVTEAAFVIAETWPYFPKRTVHLVVVDPGVGSARRPILAEADGHFFIAPDNGVLSMVFDAAPHQVRVISNPKFMRRVISRTFHGRDVFAPAAAHLAKGAQPAAFGKPIQDFVRIWIAEPSPKGPDACRGVVLKVDRFGNLITNFAAGDFIGINTRRFEIRAGTQRIHRLALTYAEADVGDVFVIVGSSGYLEIAANQTSAANLLGLSAGAPVELDLY